MQSSSFVVELAGDGGALFLLDREQALGQLLQARIRLLELTIALAKLHRLLLELVNQHLAVFLELRTLVARRFRPWLRVGVAPLARQDLQREFLVLGFAVDDEGNRREMAVRPPFPQERIAVPDRHQQIGDHQVWRGLRGPLQCLGAVPGLHHLETTALQHAAQQVEVDIMVGDDQDARHQRESTPVEMVERKGIEPSTSALRTQRSPS